MELPMFPLGSVLLPRMPLTLQLFEPRYLLMLQRLLDEEVPEFGVVLIERGREVGGGDARFARGTVARIAQVAPGDGVVALAAVGTRRLEIASWLPDAPWPVAEVREVPDLDVRGLDPGALASAEARVRRSLARAAEYGDADWPADIEISEDPEVAAWQLAGVAPISTIDRYALLDAGTGEELLCALLDALDHADAVRDAPGLEGSLEGELADLVGEQPDDEEGEDPDAR